MRWTTSMHPSWFLVYDLGNPTLKPMPLHLTCLYTPMLNLIFQEQLLTTSFWQQWYFFAPWWWCWIGGVLAWISMAMVNLSTWNYLWTGGFSIVPWSNSLLFNINNSFNCISKRYIILNFYYFAPPWFKKILTLCFAQFAIAFRSSQLL